MTIEEIFTTFQLCKQKAKSNINYRRMADDKYKEALETLIAAFKEPINSKNYRGAEAKLYHYLDYHCQVGENDFRNAVDKEDVRSAYNDACIEVIKDIQEGLFLMNASLESYFYRIFKNRIIDINRYNNAAQRTVPNDDEQWKIWELLVGQGFDIETEIDKETQRQDVQNCLDKIGIDCKKALIWNAEGFKNREIADELNIPIGSVNNRINNCMKQLKPCLEQKGYR